MTISDWVMVVAVLVGPLIAVQLTRYLDDLKEKRGRKLWIFKTLMATRAQGQSSYHFDKTSIKNSSYTPNGHQQLEDDQTVIRQGRAEAAGGERRIPDVRDEFSST